MKNDRLWFAARILVGLVMAYAGWTKLIEPVENFEAALTKYGVLPPRWTPWVASVLPWVEWVLGASLIVGYAPRLAAGGASLVFLSFLVVLTSSGVFIEAGQADCGCFGKSGIHLSMRQIFFVDLACLAAALRLTFLKEHRWSFHRLLVKERK